ncbi:MAG: hypothetical protein QMD82_00360, partial [bacterium]|nr:hypothetical protein [bacterium]
MWSVLLFVLLSVGSHSIFKVQGVKIPNTEKGKEILLAEKMKKASRIPIESQFSAIEAEPEEIAVKEGEKADRDTLKIDTDGTTVYYWGTTTYKYFWLEYDINRLKPTYSPADSTFILTSVSLLVYNPQAVECTLWVYDKYMSEVYKGTFSLSLGNGISWFEVAIDKYLPLYDTFTVVVYLPTSSAGANYYNQPTLDATQPIESCSGYLDKSTSPWTWYYLTNYDLRIRAIG